MRPSVFLRVACLFLAALSSLPAQVPQFLNYQGRVRVSGADFTGTGQFKFAMVSNSGATTYWSNDGTSTAGSQPAAAVSLAVQNGLYQVLLGDATLPNMRVLPASVFTNSGVSLRVWFSDGLNGWQQMTPDQRVAAVGYAMMAESVRDGSVTSAKLAAGAVNSSNIANGAVNAAALSSTAVTENLNAAGQGTVPAGAGLFSTQPNAPALLAAGYVSAGNLTSGDSWQTLQGGTARDFASVVWTGTEMLIWGDGPEGWRFNPSTNVWTAMATAGQPAIRENALAVWTGTEMLVWGGSNANGYQSTGGRYHPATDTWAIMAPTNAPAARSNSTAVWTGTEMIVWGGFGGGSLNTGGRYNPAIGGGGTWSALPTAGAPVARYWHTAVWTGAEMIIFGGTNGATTYGDGGRFNPSGGGTWSTLATGPSARAQHTAVWTPNGMIVWGGSAIGTTAPNGTGGLYNPATLTWSALSTTNAPDPRFQHSAVWNGTEMIVWGGSTSNVNNFVYSNTGGAYNPLTSSWLVLSPNGAPAGRVLPAAVWTGTEMIIWGGSNGPGNPNLGTPLNTGGRYRTGQTLYLYQRP